MYKLVCSVVKMVDAFNKRMFLAPTVGFVLTDVFKVCYCTWPCLSTYGFLKATWMRWSETRLQLWSHCMETMTTVIAGVFFSWIYIYSNELLFRCTCSRACSATKLLFTAAYE